MLKSTISNPSFKTVAITSLATLFFCGVTAQTALAETKVPAKDIVAEATADADFKKLDVNGDKKVSLKEAVKDKALVTSFDATDANKDGNITPDEYSSYKTSMKSLDGAAPAAAPVN